MGDKRRCRARWCQTPRPERGWRPCRGAATRHGLGVEPWLRRMSLRPCLQGDGGSCPLAASRGARAARRSQSGAGGLRAGKGGPDQFAIDRIKNGGQHDRTPLFDRGNTNKRSFQTDFIGSLKWLHCTPETTCRGSFGGVSDRNITCQSKALILGCAGSAFGGVWDESSLVLRGSGTRSVADRSRGWTVTTSRCPEVVAGFGRGYRSHEPSAVTITTNTRW